jgi:hypothetical protein
MGGPDKTTGPKNPKIASRKSRKETSIEQFRSVENYATDSDDSVVSLVNPHTAHKVPMMDFEDLSKEEMSNRMIAFLQMQNEAAAREKAERAKAEREREEEIQALRLQNQLLQQKLMPAPAFVTKPPAVGKQLKRNQSRSQSRQRQMSQDSRTRLNSESEVSEYGSEKWTVAGRKGKKTRKAKAVTSPPSKVQKYLSISAEGENPYCLRPGETNAEMRERVKYIVAESQEALQAIMARDPDFNPFEEMRAKQAQASRKPARGLPRANPPPSPTRAPALRPSFPSKKIPVSETIPNLAYESKSLKIGFDSKDYVAPAAKLAKAKAKRVAVPPPPKPQIKNYEDYESGDEIEMEHSDNGAIPKNLEKDQKQDPKRALAPSSKDPSIGKPNVQSNTEDPYAVTGPQGARYVPRTCPDQKPVHMATLYSEVEQWEDTLQTKGSLLHLSYTQGESIPKGDTGLINFVNFATTQGFITFKVEPMGNYVQFCANGFVVLIQKSSDSKKGRIMGKLHIPLAIRQILENSFIYKVGFNIQDSLDRLEKYHYIEIKVKGLYDIKWGHPFYEKNVMGSLDDICRELDGEIFPSESHVKTDISLKLDKTWESTPEEIQKYLLQEVRGIHFQMYKYFKKIAYLKYARRGNRGPKDLTLYSRHFFYKHGVLGLSKKLGGENRSVEECARIAKFDPYYKEIGPDPYICRVENEERYFGPIRILITTLEDKEFDSWNSDQHFTNCCQLCGIPSEEGIIHDCMLKVVEWEGGVCCQYPLCGWSTRHTLLTCPMILSWCQKCERRGHVPEHHDGDYDMVTLEDMYLANEPYNLLTGFKLMAPSQGLVNRITPNVLRFSLYGNTWSEVPKSYLMGRPFIPDRSRPEHNVQHTDPKFKYDPTKDPWSKQFVQVSADAPGYVVKGHTIVRNDTFNPPPKESKGKVHKEKQKTESQILKSAGRKLFDALMFKCTSPADWNQFFLLKHCIKIISEEIDCYTSKKFLDMSDKQSLKDLREASDSRKKWLAEMALELQPKDLSQIALERLEKSSDTTVELREYAKRYNISTEHAKQLCDDPQLKIEAEELCLNLGNINMTQAIETLLDRRDFKRNQLRRLKRDYKISHSDANWVLEYDLERKIQKYCRHERVSFRQGIEVLRAVPNLDPDRAENDMRKYGLTHNEAYYFQREDNTANVNMIADSQKCTIKEAIAYAQENYLRRPAKNADIRQGVPVQEWEGSKLVSGTGTKVKSPTKVETGEVLDTVKATSTPKVSRKEKSLPMKQSGDQVSPIAKPNESEDDIFGAAGKASSSEGELTIDLDQPSDTESVVSV